MHKPAAIRITHFSSTVMLIKLGNIYYAYLTNVVSLVCCIQCIQSAKGINMRTWMNYDLLLFFSGRPNPSSNVKPSKLQKMNARSQGMVLPQKTHQEVTVRLPGLLEIRNKGTLSCRIIKPILGRRKESYIVSLNILRNNLM